jgi:hypothetical protein
MFHVGLQKKILPSLQTLGMLGTNLQLKEQLIVLWQYQMGLLPLKGLKALILRAVRTSADWHADLKFLDVNLIFLHKLSNEIFI